MTIIKPLGSSEEQIASWQKMGIKYDKRTIKQMIAAYHTPPGATEQSILKFESTLPAKLPEDYRKFLLMHDGGVPDPPAFNIPSENNSSVIKELFGLDTPRRYNTIEICIKIEFQAISWLLVQTHLAIELF